MRKLISLLLAAAMLLSLGMALAEESGASLFAWDFVPLTLQNDQVSAKGTLAWNSAEGAWLAIFDSSYGVAELQGSIADGALTLEQENVRVTNGYGKYYVADIQALYDEVSAGWQGMFIAFESNGNQANGNMFWNAASGEWKASFATPYGDAVLSGSYDAEGTLTLTSENEEVTKGYGKYYLFDLQALLSDALNGWKNAPLSFAADEISANGDLYWNPVSMEWRTVFESPYGEVVLTGTISENGELVLVSENTNGYGKYYVQPVQAEFDKVLTGNIPMSNADEIVDILEQHARNIEAKYDAASTQGQIVFYGASNFRMWDNMEEDLAPYPVQNHGIGGSTDQDLVEFADRLLYAYAPSIVVFQTGSNDFVNLTDQGYSDEDAVEECLNYKAQMFAAFHEQLPDAKFVVMSAILMPGRTQFTEMNQIVNQRLQALCDEHDYMYFVNAEDLTFDGTNYATELFRDDMIHLTAEGEKLWADSYILPMLEELTK